MALFDSYFAVYDQVRLKKRAVQYLVKRVADRACIVKEVTPHVLRRTFSTLALQKGLSVAALQKILGHDRLETTAIYLNLTEEHVLDEFQAKW
jgi:integrase/recombinase XerD